MTPILHDFVPSLTSSMSTTFWVPTTWASSIFPWAATIFLSMVEKHPSTSHKSWKLESTFKFMYRLILTLLKIYRNLCSKIKLTLQQICQDKHSQKKTYTNHENTHQSMNNFRSPQLQNFPKNKLPLWIEFLWADTCLSFQWVLGRPRVTAAATEL